MDAETERRIAGFIPSGCEGIFPGLFSVPAGVLELQSDNGGLFPWRPHMRENMWPLVYSIRCWRTPGALAAGQNIQLQYGFVQDGFTAPGGPLARLFDGDNIVLLGGLPWQDTFTEGPIPVPHTAGQPWAFFVRTVRTGAPLPTQAMRCELLWGYQPTVRFAG